MFKRFSSLPDTRDRAGSEDPDQDDETAGLNPLKIKPRVLFPSAPPKLSKADVEEEDGEDAGSAPEVDEEAETDIDEYPPSQSSSIVISSKKAGKRPVVSRMTPESESDELPPVSSFKARLQAASKKRLSGSKALFDADEDGWHPAASKGVLSSDDEGGGQYPSPEC